MSDRRTILVLANETLEGEELLDAVRRHAGQGEVLVRVVAPVSAPRASPRSATSSTTTRSPPRATRSRSTSRTR